MKKIFYSLCIEILIASSVLPQQRDKSSSQKGIDSLKGLKPPVQLTEEVDHLRMMKMLGIDSLRPGPSGNPNAPNAANTDESKAIQYKSLPDPLTLNNGKKVTSAKVWWNKRPPEIVEDFDREVYGRMPKHTPSVNWEVVNTKNDTIGKIPAITKKLVGHVDNSSYPYITVDIQLSLTTPANTTKPVPVIMEFGFDFSKFKNFDVSKLKY